MPQNIRPASVAGKFYPSNPDELSSQIEDFLSQAGRKENTKKIKGLILPHAGIIFSGAVAAQGYARLQDTKIKRVVLMCNSHSAYFEGLALSPAQAWDTPLGEVKLNTDLAEKIKEQVEEAVYNEEAHKNDHTLEIQLPFLQTVLTSDFEIVPVLFGNLDSGEYESLVKVLAENLGPDDLLVASSDMSHYPPYEEANRIDPETLKIISSLQVGELEEYISEVESRGIPGVETLLCGIDGVKTLMDLSRIQGWQAEVLDYKNSGDTALGDKESVVGYGAVVFWGDEDIVEGEEDFNQEEKNILLEVAQKSVESFVSSGKVPEFDIQEEKLNQGRGVFVTLKKGEELRGCIGQIVQTEKPLWELVQEMAIAAATEDNRFSPVTPEELSQLNYEISVLSLPEPVRDWQNIKLGKHGVIVRKDNKSGVFLPQVAEETGWNKEEFLSQLCWQKAGLQPDSFKNDKDLEMYTFTSEVFSQQNK